MTRQYSVLPEEEITGNPFMNISELSEIQEIDF